MFDVPGMMGDPVGEKKMWVRGEEFVRREMDLEVEVKQEVFVFDRPSLSSLSLPFFFPS